MNMMNVTEESFVRSAFSKEFRDRLCYELASPKKRDRFFDKIAHNCDEYILGSAVYKRSDRPMSESDIVSFFGDGKEVSVIARGSELDGRKADIHTALKALSENGLPFILADAAERRAYLETEYDFSVHTSYMLKY